MFAQCFRGVANLALAGQEHQRVTGAGGCQYLIDSASDRRIEIDLFVVIVRTHRPIVNVHRIHAARHFDHRRAVEMLGETRRVDRGRCDYDFEFRALRQQLLQVAEQKIDIDATLVGLVDNQRVVVGQKAVTVNFRQQNAVGHHFNQSIFLHPIGEANLITDQLANFRVQFLRDARRDAARRDTARLSAANGAVNAAFELKTNFRQLRGFPRAGLATDNYYRVRSDGCLDLLAPIGDWQIITEGRLWELLLAMLGFFLRNVNLLRQFLDCGGIILSSCTVEALAQTHPIDE